MGRMLGSYSSEEELDRPDLNKCPDCACFFAADNCPLCGKECPEHMRAGNRPAVKKRRRRPRSGSDRVVFIEWYHSWWFIVIMMFLFPLVGIILLATSPHQRWKKGVFITIAVLYLLLSSIGVGQLASRVTELWDRPVNTSLTREEYIARCETVSAEQFYRLPESYEDEFVCVTLRVVGRASYVDGYYNADDIYYICEAADGSSYRILVRDCLVDGARNLIAGDVITVYGEGDGQRTAMDADYTQWDGPCLNMAYVLINNQ